MNVLPNMYVCPLRKGADLPTEGTVKCTHLVPYQTDGEHQAKLTKIGAIK